jgi:hypothetical protein
MWTNRCANEADKQIIMGDGNHEHRTHDNVHMQPLKNIGIQISSLLQQLQVIIITAFTYGSAKSIGNAVSCILDGELNPIPYTPLRNASFL